MGFNTRFFARLDLRCLQNGREDVTLEALKRYRADLCALSEACLFQEKGQADMRIPSAAMGLLLKVLQRSAPGGDGAAHFPVMLADQIYKDLSEVVCAAGERASHQAAAMRCLGQLLIAAVSATPLIHAHAHVHMQVHTHISA